MGPNMMSAVLEHRHAVDDDALGLVADLNRELAGRYPEAGAGPPRVPEVVLVNDREPDPGPAK